MNFFKKIIPKFVAFSIILCLSFTLTCCPLAPSTKPKITEPEITEPEIDLELVEFWNTFDTYSELIGKRTTLLQKHLEYTYGSTAIDEAMMDLMDLMLMGLDPTTDSFTRKVLKLSQNSQDILEEGQKILDKLMDNLYDQSHIISKLQGNVVKITDPSKRLLAQEIVDKLREMHNLMFEETELIKKVAEYIYSEREDTLALFLGKITFERLFKNLEERDEKIEENNERIEEVQKAIDSLTTEVSDLITKLESLGPYK